MSKVKASKGFINQIFGLGTIFIILKNVNIKKEKPSQQAHQSSECVIEFIIDFIDIFSYPNN